MSQKDLNVLQSVTKLIAQAKKNSKWFKK